MCYTIDYIFNKRLRVPSLRVISVTTTVIILLVLLLYVYVYVCMCDLTFVESRGNRLIILINLITDQAYKLLVLHLFINAFLFLDYSLLRYLSWVKFVNLDLYLVDLRVFQPPFYFNKSIMLIY